MKYHLEFEIDFKRNPYKGRFIALEGIDGSGKSTQALRLKEYLEKKGRKVVTKHPFEGEIGKFVRTILAGERKVPPIALQYLIAANRSVQQNEIIEALKAGKDVIIDRYFWSDVAYGILDHSASVRKKAGQWLLIRQGILSQYHQFLSPDLNFFLDISSRTASKRIDKMGKKKEIYEQEAKIAKIEEIYKWLVREFKEEFIVIDAEQPVEEVTKEMIKIISGRK